MPYRWEDRTKGAPDTFGAFSFAAGDAPALVLTLWPHRSLPRRGFVAFIGVTVALMALPLIGLLGTLALWAILPFLAAAVAAVWYFLQRSYRDGELREDLSIWSDRVELVRLNPRGARQDWSANPHWVRVEMHKDARPVENYLTLKGGGREVEIGAFLSPEERSTLFGELQREIGRTWQAIPD